LQNMQILGIACRKTYSEVKIEPTLSIIAGVEMVVDQGKAVGKYTSDFSNKIRRLTSLLEIAKAILLGHLLGHLPEHLFGQLLMKSMGPNQRTDHQIASFRPTIQVRRKIRMTLVGNLFIYVDPTLRNTNFFKRL